MQESTSYSRPPHNEPASGITTSFARQLPSNSFSVRQGAEGASHSAARSLRGFEQTQALPVRFSSQPNLTPSTLDRSQFIGNADLSPNIEQDHATYYFPGMQVSFKHLNKPTKFLQPIILQLNP